MQNQAKVGVSVVNYRIPHLVKECLQSLAEERRWVNQLYVVVIDNNSGDGSLETLSEYVSEMQWHDWVTVIGAPRNGGFSYGNNLAFKLLLEQHQCNYIWMLNPDTRVLPQAGKKLLDFIQARPAVGMVGSQLQAEDGSAQVSAFNFPSPMGELLNGSRLGLLDKWFSHKVIAPKVNEYAHRTDWLAGASIMLSRELIEKIGFMDEDYFLYFEEVDYCRAASKAGFQMWLEPESRVVHLMGASTGISDWRKKATRRPKYWFDSRRRYFLKNYGRRRTLVADAMWILGYCSWLARKTLQKKTNLDPPYFLRDFIRNSVLIRGFDRE
jgi:GT2 family glycosyltransferase